MFSAVFTDPNNALLKDRLARISEFLRSLSLPTAEEYQAAVYSAVNSVLSLGYAMTPLYPVSSEGPAVVGDAAVNFAALNNDAQDIANELLRIEDAAGRLFNLSATSQNQLRQQIRELIYGSTHRKYSEYFLNSNKLTSVTAGLDFNAGVATTALLDEVQIIPSVTSGVNSIGSLEAEHSFSDMLDARPDTAMVWNGSQLELIITFPTATIINRMKMNLDEYVGLEVTTFTTSPDGTLAEDVLEDLKVDRILIDGMSSKASGDIIVDFPPRHTVSIRLILTDRVGLGRITLRELAFFKRRYSSSGKLTTVPIEKPHGTVKFSVEQNVFNPLVSITHQISYDGAQFKAIKTGDIIQLLSSPFYYRAVLERSSAKFDSGQEPLAQMSLDPRQSSGYRIINTTSVPLGNGIIERSITLNGVTGPVVLREIPMLGTLQVQEGAIILSSATGDYTFENNTVSFSTSKASISITYQTTSLGLAALRDREEYYTPLLFSITFEKVDQLTDSPSVILGGLIPPTIYLAWAASLDLTVTGYNVYRSLVPGGPYTLLASNVPVAAYSDSATVRGTTYYYVTTAITISGESSYSNEIVETAP